MLRDSGKEVFQMELQSSDRQEYKNVNGYNFAKPSLANPNISMLISLGG